MKPLALLILILLIGLCGCSKQASGKPDDFQLVLDWHTGSLPEPYSYAYKVIIGPGDQGELHYRSGNNESKLNLIFQVSGDETANLHKFITENGMIRSKWDKGDPIDGGPVTFITIKSDGKSHSIPERSELSNSERLLVDHLIDRINASVPSEAFDELNSLQHEYETNYN